MLADCVQDAHAKTRAQHIAILARSLRAKLEQVPQTKPES
jgi:hypothetical protein